MGKTDVQTRQTGLDLLKICAFFCVVCLHVTAKPWQILTTDSQQFFICNLFRGTWGVPVFIMTTGCFLLDPAREADMEKMKKYILRAVIAFLFWTVAYTAYSIFIAYPVRGVTQIQWKWEVTEMIRGEYHLWYLPMLVGLYLVIPFLRKITQDTKLMQWYLVLFFLWETLTRYMVYLPKVGVLLQPIADNLHFHFAAGYAGYLVLGYWLSTVSLKKWQEYSLYCIGVLGLFTASLGNWLWSGRVGERSTVFSETLTPNLILAAAALFYLFRNRIANADVVNQWSKQIGQFAQLGFGAYLIHVLFINFLTDFGGVVFLTENPLLWIPVLTVAISAVSLVCSALLRKIPVIGKYIA